MDSWRELREIRDWSLSVWARSLGVVVALVVGVVVGIVVRENQVIDDCKYMKSFRIGNQSFTCERRI